MLNVNGQEITDPQDVMNAFAQHYASVSANNTFPESLQSRQRNLANSCDFTSNNTEIYNKPFTLRELTHAISMCGQTSGGPDDIHYDFFKHLSKNTLTYLLTAINNLFQTTPVAAEAGGGAGGQVATPLKDVRGQTCLFATPSEASGRVKKKLNDL